MSKLRGLERVVRNLNKEIKAIEGRSIIGLGKAAMLVRHDMDQTPPLIPVDTGNLRASWFIEPLKAAKGPAVLMGFNANYAVYVHEMIGAIFQRPGAGPKFFQSSLRRNSEKIISIIKADAEIAK